MFQNCRSRRSRQHSLAGSRVKWLFSGIHACPTGHFWRARRYDFLQWLQGDLPDPVSSAKRFLFSITPNQIYNRAVPARKRGVSRSSRTLGWDAVDAAASSRVRIAGRAERPLSDRPARGRTALKRTAKPCGPGTRCWCQAGGGFLGPTGSRSTANPPATVTRRIRRRGEHVISR
jgi:hypothetical protein